MQSTFWDKVLEAQREDVKATKIWNKVESRVENPFWILDDGIITMRKWMYLAKDMLKNEVLK